MALTVVPTRLEGPLLLAPQVFGDERGFFAETFRLSELRELGLEEDWVQDNHSRSGRGVVRGMHFQAGAPQAKLVRCGRGEILDVVVDVRRGSPTFGEWEGFALDDRSLRMVYVPPGFAHGFVALGEVNDVLYKQSAYYDPRLEGGIAFDDPEVGVAWPDGVELQPSARDREAPRLRDVAGSLPFVFSG